VPIPSRYLPALTGLRFWAALHVLLFHLIRGKTFAGRVVSSGQMSVGLFFVLSGFILAHTYLASGGLKDTRSFFAARIARIYPLYLVGIGLVLLAEFLPAPLGSDRGLVSGRSVTESVLLVQAWDPRYACSVNCPGWSLSAEAFFYLSFPLAAAVLVRRSLTGLRIVMMATVIVSLALGVAFVVDRGATFGVYAGLFGTHADPVFLYHPITRLPEFVFGATLGLLAMRWNRLQAWASAHSTIVAVTSAGLILIVYSLLPGWPWLPIGQALLLPLFGALILALAFASPQVESHFGNRLAHRLGEWSYALYILHFPVMLFYSNVASHRWAPQTDTAGGVVLQIALCLGAAGLGFHLVEVPARRRIRRALSLTRAAG
jgi:peptidoglycan/LPS O-acetylase OafA/YrhL